MRVEPYTVGSYVHVIKRGARGVSIVNDETDKWRFVRSLFYMNDVFFDHNWERVTKELGFLQRPDIWPSREPLVQILCFTLMPNHFHLVLKEIRESGVSEFMQKLGQSMTNHFNQKYKQRGSLFQGSYKSKTIGRDEHLRYVAAYIMVKNVFELYPRGGLDGAVENFNKAWEWASKHPFTSLGDYAGIRENSVILEKEILGEIYQNSQQFKKFARDVILGGKWLQSEFE
jgi:putative transposase